MHIFLPLLLLAIPFSAFATNPTAKNGAETANATLEERGSPYRWVVGDTESDGTTTLKKQLIGEPCATAADPTLTSDTLANIGKAETQVGGVSVPSLIETRCIVGARQDTVTEIWVVSRGDKQVPYVVNFVPKPAGGVKIEILGPW